MNFMPTAVMTDSSTRPITSMPTYDTHHQVMKPPPYGNVRPYGTLNGTLSSENMSEIGMYASTGVTSRNAISERSRRNFWIGCRAPKLAIVTWNVKITR